MSSTGFGPASELISIDEFLRSSASELFSLNPSQVTKHDTLEALSQEEKDALEAECSVSALTTELSDLWDNPILSATFLEDHDETVSNLYAKADASYRRKRKRGNADAEKQPVEESTNLLQQIKNVKLGCWRLSEHAASFARATRNSDQNVLTRVKRTANNDSEISNEVLIYFTVYRRINYSPGYSRSSQHVLASSQSLGDLYETIPCVSNEIPEAIMTEDGKISGYSDTATLTSGCVILIEDIAYGDGESEEDYADKLIAQLALLQKGDAVSPIKKSPTCMHDTILSSLSFRINEPYWLLHQGNCEHYIVVEKIRLQHPSDPVSGYPLTTQIAPPLIDHCRGCTKAPAVWSITGDLRLGESPCTLCAPCWRNIGPAASDEEVVVTPLPKYEFGW